MPTDIRVILWVLAAVIVWLVLVFGVQWPT